VSIQQSFFSTMSLSLFASNAALAFLGGANLGGKVPAQPELAGKAAFKAAQFPGLGAPSEVRPGYASGLPGDIGFDPLGLANFDLTVASATDKKRSAALVLQDYRDAELKHGRLAMMAAVAFPLQEKLNPILAAQLRWPNLVAETGGLSPSVLNGGLEQGPIPGVLVTFAVLVSLVEAQGLRIKKSDGDDWLPGDYGTLRIAEKGTEQFFSLQEGEIWNGRIAMIATLAYVAQEFITKVPTAATIPFF